MKKYLIIILYIYSFTICNLSVIAQEIKFGLPEIEYFNRQQYSGATQNWKISQSCHDLMYFANNDGLLEYDGVSWRLHKNMKASVVRSVNCIGPKIYVGAHDEFGYFEYDSLNQFKYNSLSNDERLKQNGDYWSIHELNGEVLFQGEKSIGVLKDNRMIDIIPAKSTYVSSFIVNNRYLVQDESEGLMEMITSKLVPLKGGHLFRYKRITFILPLQAGKIVVGTMKNGLYLWDESGIKEWDIKANTLIKESSLFCGTNYNKEYLIFGTIQNGILITNLDGEIVMHINKDKGLKNNTVLSIYVDKEGSIWAGLDNGIAKISMNSNITLLQGYYNIGTGYVQNQYKNNWFFGTNQGLYQIDKSRFGNPLKSREDFEKVRGTDGQVWSLYSDRKSLLCGHNNGVLEIKAGKSKLITPPSISGIWNFKTIPNRSHLLLVGTYKGLSVLEYKNSEWTFKNSISGFDHSSRFMEWDKQGNLWVSQGYQYVYKIKLSADLQYVENVDTIGKEQIPGNEALLVSKINDDCIIYGGEGIYKILEDGNIEPFTLLDTFFDKSNLPKFIHQDQFRNIWFFHVGKVGVLRYLEDGTYKKIVYPFVPIKNKLINSFESVYITDRENVFLV